MMRRYIPGLVVLGLATLAVTILGTGAVLRSEPTVPPPGGEPESPGVVVYGQVDVRDGQVPLFPPTFPAPSTVAAVSPEAVEGATVRKGQVLATLDDRLARAAVAEAQAGLKQARGKLAQVKADGRRAEKARDALVAQQTKAVEAKQREYNAKKLVRDQLERLLKEQSANSTELAAANEGLKGLEAGLAVESLRLEQARDTDIDFTPGVEQAEAAVAQYQALLEKAQYGLSLCELKAPSDGTILRALTTDGLQFGPQTKQPAFWFLPKGPMIVRVEVAQEFADRVHVGQKATLFDDRQTVTRWHGTVTGVGQAFLPRRSSVMLPDPFQFSESRVLECTVTLDEHGEMPRVGQRLRASLGDGSARQR